MQHEQFKSLTYSVVGIINFILCQKNIYCKKLPKFWPASKLVFSIDKKLFLTLRTIIVAMLYFNMILSKKCLKVLILLSVHLWFFFLIRPLKNTGAFRSDLIAWISC